MKEKLISVLYFLSIRIFSFFSYQITSFISLVSPTLAIDLNDKSKEFHIDSTTTIKPKDDDPVHVLSVENGKVSHRIYKPDRVRKYVEKNSVPVSKSNSFH